MKRALPGLIALVLLVLPTLLVSRWTHAAAERLKAAEAAADDKPQAALAAAANEAYCTPDLQRVLRRVLQSCGLLNAGGRGCQPADAASVATMDGGDFNALFVPMQGRGGIVQYEKGSAELAAEDQAMIERVFADRRGASYFFVVARASPEGSEAANRALSRERAETVLSHLQAKFDDPHLKQQVGLLWLGEEYAQLDPSFCEWPRSGEAGACSGDDLNRSAFITWIDCTL